MLKYQVLFPKPRSRSGLYWFKPVFISGHSSFPGVRRVTASSAQFFRQFFYRFNSNGTIDAICSLCFQTIATVGNQADLRNFEAAHHCQGG